ncbi:hypothetical protein GC167_04940 [bacterium]|nr:hypothetical protein [bacterium]
MKIMFWAGVRFLAYGNGAVALAALAYATLFSAFFGFVDRSYLEFVFFGTFSAYAYMHFLSALQHPTEAVHPVRLYTREHWLPLMVLGLLSGVYAGFLWIRHFSEWGRHLLLVGAVVVVYPGFGHLFRGLRSLKGLKLPLIVLVWGYLVAVLPWWLSDHRPAWPEAFGAGLAAVHWILGTALLFDLRDAHIDPQGFTLPQRLGKSHALLLVRGLYAASALVFCTVGLLQPPWRVWSWSAVVCLAAAMALTRLWNRTGNPLWISLWIEILPVFWLVFWMMGR